MARPQRRPVSERSELGRRASSPEKRRGPSRRSRIGLRRARGLLVPFGPSENVRETFLTSRQRWPGGRRPGMAAAKGTRPRSGRKLLMLLLLCSVPAIPQKPRHKLRATASARCARGSLLSWQK
ncbi:Hypothetical protein I596_2431 [Dokdonella koreensis DS-123]|uniref:Uncharacterized protein n=1 Tax=Dokdonella koreensis DS-123 TaxID=1300342 RepID=A0A160DV95_9GAMM|nr:Hypothetical protein I596_2431 [Dokdonella koreensis DS-123]